MRAAKQFVDEVKAAANSHYLWVGRGEPWTTDTTPDVPYDNTFYHTNDVWQRMQSLKKVSGTSDITFAAPRYQWISGTTYSEYDDRDIALESKKFYAITDNNHVMICIKAGSGASTTNPDNTGVQTAGVIDFSASDGYIWKYLFTLTTTASSKFLTSAFIPVDFLAANPGGAAAQALQDQFSVQSAAVNGGIHNIKVVTGGSGYSASDTFTVTINGDGTSASVTDANVTVTSGVITNLKVAAPGSGYTKAKVTVTSDGSGSGCTARAVISPRGGFGADPREDLRAHYTTVSLTLTGAEGGDFVVGNEYRQLGLIRNPYAFGTTSGTTFASATTMFAMYTLTVSTGSGAPNASEFTNDATIIGSATGALGIIDTYDAAAGVIYYHQTETTGYTAFTTSDNVKISGSANTARNVTAVGNPEVQPDSGEVIFMENRTSVLRASDQSEAVKLVLEF